MTRGGPRNRNGSHPDPSSERSSRAGLVFKLLPNEGFTGPIPAFPLPKPSPRERAVWRALWRTPQAAMWNEERWRMHVVGLYARWSVRAEAEDASAAVLGQVHRLADQLGLTPAGLKENGWRTRIDTGAGEAMLEPTASRPSSSGVPARRLRAVVPIETHRHDGGDD